MADGEAVPSIFELNYLDLTLYQHPPFTFILWYLVMGLKAGVEVIMDLIESDGGGGGGGGGSAPPPADEPEEAEEEEG